MMKDHMIYIKSIIRAVKLTLSSFIFFMFLFSININLHLLPTIVEVIIRAAAVDLIFAPRQLTEWQRSCTFFVIVNFALKALYFSRQYWKSSCGYDNVRCGTDDKLYTFQVLSGILWLKLRMVMFACLSDYIIK